MTDQLVDHLRTLHDRLDRWLATMDPLARIDALSDVHGGVVTLMQLVRRARRETLAELVDLHGLAEICRAMDVSENRMLQLLAGSSDL